MALHALDAIREAELSAQKSVVSAQENAQQRIADAQTQAEMLLAEAEEKVKFEKESSSERAYKKAEEVFVTSRNSALLQAEKLREDCMQKQTLVNEKVIELIV